MGAAQRFVVPARGPGAIDLRISVAHQADRTLVAVAGELDVASTSELQARLGEGDVAKGDVIVDLSQLSFVDASGLHALVAAYRGASQRGQRLRVSRTSPSLERLLTLTGARGLLGLAEPAV